MRLLDELLDRCLSGDCDQATAAKVLGIRKASLAELVHMRAAERQAYRTLVGAFQQTFPECDPRLARRYRLPAQVEDPLFRSHAITPTTTYTGTEVEDLPPSQPHITRELEKALMDHTVMHAQELPGHGLLRDDWG